MTVSYHSKYSSQGLNTFLKLLLRWRGSVYKLLYKELLIYLLIYAVLSLVYRFALNPTGRLKFEQLSITCQEYSRNLPVTFLLGLYINFLVARWWDQLKSIPWPDGIGNMLNTIAPECTDEAREFRKSVTRYLILALIIRLREMGSGLGRRFPTMESVLNEGYIKKDELVMLEKLKGKYTMHFLPLQWAARLATERIRNCKDLSRKLMLPNVTQALNDYGANLRLLFLYGKVPVPLVYTQAVTIAVYTYFLALLLGRQYLTPAPETDHVQKHNIDMYVPFFTMLEYVFYVGWLKVAEAIMNPFGDDDEDFDCCWFVDRHTQIANQIVNQCWLLSVPPGDGADDVRSDTKCPLSRQQTQLVSDGFTTVALINGYSSIDKNESFDSAVAIDNDGYISDIDDVRNPPFGETKF